MSMLALFLMQVAPAQSWALNGTVVNGANCTPLQGVNISTPYNNHGFNISNSKGFYLLYLGYGSWNVTASKAGYQSVTFVTPYEYGGSFENNFAITPIGQTTNPSCVNSLHGANSTVPSTVSATTSTPVNSTPTSIPTSTPASSTGGQSAASSGTTMAIVAVIVVIIVLVGGYYLLKGKGKKGGAAHEAHTQHTQHPQHQH